MVEDLKLKINQFEKFYYFLMKEAPEDYIPWFFPCEPKGKDPCPSAILKIDSSSKGSWHHSSARLNKDQVVEHIKQGYNIGLSAREGDALIIIDVDNPKYFKDIPTDTLTAQSRKRMGGHIFCWDKDGSAKINLPTDHGEIRSNNQYVLSCGSYVPFDLENEKDKKAFEELPDKAKEDKLIGYYTILTSEHPKEITFSEVPEFFKDKQEENLEVETDILQTEEKNEYKKEGKYSDLFKLKVSDILGKIPAKKRTGHPLHESDTDANFSLTKDGSLGHCWRHLVSLNAVQYLCIKNGYSKCEDAGTPHKGRGISKIRGDKKAYKIAYDEALKLGLIKEHVPKKIQTILQSHYTKKQLAEEIFDVQPYFYDSSKMWWLWNNELFKWEIKDDKDILIVVSKNSDANTVNSKEKNEIIEAMQQLGRGKIPKEIKKTWIQFKDTIVDYETGEEFKATPEYFVTNPIPFGLHEERYIETPIMDKIFEEWVGKEYVKTLYEIISYCLIPNYPIHRLFCFIGEGMNGKSCFLRLLKIFIGKDNITSTELDSLLHSRFEITKLHKKLVCVMGETNFAEMSKTSVIKKLTGQDTIGYEYKNKNPFDDVNYAKILIATNNLPTTTDKTIGFYRRWLIIDFPNRFSEKKDILNDIPQEEYEILTIKSLKILKDLMDKKSFHNEGTIEDREKKYEEKSNPFDKFWSENIIEDINVDISKKKFKEKLDSWCKENRFRLLSEVTISKHMKDKEIETTRLTMTWIDVGYGKEKPRYWGWSGIKFKGEDQELSNLSNLSN